MKTIKFFCLTFPLCLFIWLTERPYRIVCWFMGLGNPISPAMTALKLEWKDLCGAEVESVNAVVVNGYMYHRVTYVDGSTLLVRGA